MMLGLNHEWCKDKFVMLEMVRRQVHVGNSTVKCVISKWYEDNVRDLGNSTVQTSA